MLVSARLSLIPYRLQFPTPTLLNMRGTRRNFLIKQPLQKSEWNETMPKRWSTVELWREYEWCLMHQRDKWNYIQFTLGYILYTICRIIEKLAQWISKCQSCFVLNFYPEDDSTSVHVTIRCPVACVRYHDLCTKLTHIRYGRYCLWLLKSIDRLLIWYILPLVIEEHWSSANSFRNIPMLKK